MGSLDASKTDSGKVKVVIVHGYGVYNEAKGRWMESKETKYFKNFKLIEQWLKKKAGNRGGGVLPVKCTKGICTFISNCCLHNTLFLDKITYGYDKGYYIKAIYIDAD